MTKTVILDGSEQMVECTGGRNMMVINKSDSPVYASRNQNIIPYEDDVMEIDPGSRDTVEGANGVVYLSGTGRIEVRGVDYVGFKKPSSSTGNGGGGGGKVGDIICGTAEYTSGGIKSIPVTMIGNIEESFAAALAEETGWELQPDGVSVLSGGAGFRFVYRDWGDFHFVCLVNDIHNSDTDYLDNLQYLEDYDADSYYMDICHGPTGAVAFGFRAKDETPKLTFMMTTDGNGNSVCMGTYYKDIRLEWGKPGDTSIRTINDDSLRGVGTEDSVIGMFKLADSDGTFEDCYCIYLVGDFTPTPGTVVSIDRKRFAIVYNHVYPINDQIWLAMAINE